ncbi:MAG: TetR/AcrR family transcriptional regulator [Sporichthyaceae bacterium]
MAPAVEVTALATVPPRGRRRRAPQTRDAILDAVRDLLHTRRLDELTVNEIVERAGISRQTFYVHFDTKYAVVAGLIANVGEGILEVWAPLFEGEGPIREDVIRECGVITIRRWREQATLFTATVEGWHNDGEIHDVWNDVLTRFGELFGTRIRRHRGSGGAQPNDDMLTGALIVAFERCLYLAVSNAESPFARSDDDLATMLAALWARALD